MQRLRRATITIVAGAAAVAVWSLPAAPAQATTFCVPGFHAACSNNGTNVAQPSLETALSTNGGDGQADLVRIAAGTFADAGSLAVGGTDDLTIAGAGRNATILTSSASANIYVVDLTNNSRDITMRDLRIQIPAQFPDGAGAGIQVSNDLLERVDIVSLNPNTNAAPTWVGGGTFRGGTIRGQGEGSIEWGIASTNGYNGTVTVEDAVIRGASTAINAQDAGDSFVVERSKLLDSTVVALVGHAGTLDVSDTLIAGSEGSFIYGLANSSANVAITADHVTIVGEGSGGSVGVISQVANPVTGDATVAMTNSIIRDKAFSYNCSAPSGAGTGNASLAISYSNFDSNTGVEAGDCTVTAGPTTNIDANPRFRSGDDFRLRAISPSIDVGNPLGIFPAFDLEGLARVTDGDTNGVAVTDQGAYEFDAKRPTTTITNGPGGSTGAGRAKFSFKANEPAASFRCALDGKRPRKCSSPKRYKRLKSGRHVFAVFAVDSYGNRDRTPAKKRFRVPG